MYNILETIKISLEKIDHFRDKVLFVFIKPLWPKRILPNHLTILRICIAVFLLVLLFYYRNNDFKIIIPLFFIGIFTDLLDGSVARAFHKETTFGTMIDPIADRLLIIPIAWYSLYPNHQLLLFWLLGLETVNGLASLWLHGKNILSQVNIFGKIKMVLQSTVFAAILVFWPNPPHLFFINILWFSIIFLIISIFVKVLESQPHAKN